MDFLSPFTGGIGIGTRYCRIPWENWQSLALDAYWHWFFQRIARIRAADSIKKISSVPKKPLRLSPFMWTKSVCSSITRILSRLMLTRFQRDFGSLLLSNWRRYLLSIRLIVYHFPWRINAPTRLSFKKPADWFPARFVFPPKGINLSIKVEAGVPKILGLNQMFVTF